MRFKSGENTEGDAKMDEKEDPVEEIAKAIESWIERLEKIERKLRAS